MLGVADGENRFEAKISRPRITIIHTLSLRSKNPRIIVASLQCPVALNVAVHFDENRKRRGNGCLHAAAKTLLAVVVLAKKRNGIVAATFTEP